MLKVWGRANSSNVQKVLWCCEELDLAYERIDLGGPFGGLDTVEYREKNPSGRIPTIDDDGFILWESHAILRYIARGHGVGKVLPQRNSDQSLCDQWLEWFAQHLWPGFLPVFFQLVRTPELERDLGVVTAGRDRTLDAIRMAENALGADDYIVGNAFSIADIPFGILGYRWFNMTWPDVPDATSTFRAYYDRIAARPAFQKVCMPPLT